MKRTAFALLAAALAASAAVPSAVAQSAATAATATVVLAGAERTEALGLANRTLNAVQRLQGRFVQTSPGGTRANGAFYLQRPGKLRFEYDPPATLLIISDGSVVSMRDTALRTTDRTPLRSTPLNLILRENVNLDRDARITRVSRNGEWLMVTARDRSGASDGQITLHFYGASAQLRSWDVIDATGARTRISLTDVTAPAALDRRLFRQEDILENRPRRS
ncbi:MAG: outer-membrane lipoprotein carrier protein LolA [Terricaulis sp.]